MTPDCRVAARSLLSLAFAKILKFSSFFHGATSAVRRPERSECSTQPSDPSESRTLRQVSNSAVISTGRPARWNTQVVAWSFEGPSRRLTRSVFRLA